MQPTSQQQNAQQRAGESAEPGPIDHTVLDRLLSDDREAVGVVLRQFRSSCPGDASALGAALSGSDNKGALRWAHRLKGACQMVGAIRFGEICERAEVAVRSGDSRAVAQIVSEVEREAQRITGYLDGWLRASP